MEERNEIKRIGKTYPGGKSGSGTYQQIINLIPPHDTYIELCIGAGGIWKNKRPAHINMGVDADPDVINYWLGSHPTKTRIGDEDHYFIFKNQCMFDFLVDYPLSGVEFIYIDPPYLKETRKNSKDIYEFEMDKEDHYKLLMAIRNYPANIMISGYKSELYDFQLREWNSFSFQSNTRRGMVTETVWFNYPFPTELHDYQYLGTNFKKRDLIKLKQKRWIERLNNLPILERRAMEAALKLNNQDASGEP